MIKEQIRYPLELIMHPFNGYWDLKYEHSKKLNLAASFLILFMVALTRVLGKQYSGFVVNVVNPDHLNSLMEILYVVVPVLFWCIANWSLTTLMDGEGKFEEIFTSTCFALTPLVLIQFPWIWLSNVISIQEAAFYHFFNVAAFLWCLGLLLVGNMTVHQLTPLKTIGTIILTVISMGFLAFLCLLIFNLIQQIVSFISLIYQELVLRN